MAPFDKSKRSVVKHKTNKPFVQGSSSGSQGSQGSKKKRGGFNVGPRHVPDGAYLGKVKRIKANLIANAKTKKQFYKSVKGKDKAEDGHPAQTDGDDGSMSLGRFAPEATTASPSSSALGREQQTVSSKQTRDGERRRDRAGPPPDEKADESDKRRKNRAGPPPSEDLAEVPNNKTQRKYASREEALAARAERQEKWNRASGSATGKKRGQPDLGARMEVLLDRIRSD